MQNPFSFEKPIAALTYAVWVLGIFLSQHLVVLATPLLHPQLPYIGLDWMVALIPLHMFGRRTLASAGDDGIVTVLLVATLLQ